LLKFHEPPPQADIVRINLKDPSTPPDQLRAAEIIIKMCGWNAPEKQQVGPSDELMEVFKKLRGVRDCYRA
jgi:hypothetical protein